MAIIESYKAYAEAFELTYEDDDWSRLEAYFTDDAQMEVESESVHGRDEVIRALKASVDNFDRLMDRRIPDFQTPTVEGNTLTMKWTVTYSKHGAPDLIISGVETAVFESDRIKHLRNTFDAESQKHLEQWMAEHGVLLKAALPG